MSASAQLAVIAGGGAAPREFLESCQRTGRSVVVACLEGQADPGLAENLPHIWMGFGEAKKLVSFLQENKVEQVVMLGRVRRPVISEIKPDMLALKILAKIGLSLVGDDALLRALGKAMEEEAGVRLIGAHEVFADMLMPPGLLTKALPDETARADVEKGVLLARELGRLDVGQSVIVQQGLVLGLETIEGTDALIRRSATVKRAGAGGVLVKMAKPQQDHRYDLPALGPDTVREARAAGLSGIAAEAGRCLVIDRARTIADADVAGLFLVGLGKGHG